jgi:hypothetical protein
MALEHIRYDHRLNRKRRLDAAARKLAYDRLGYAEVGE